MQISDKGLELIKAHEGLRLKAYRDPVGIPTIGYGHTSKAGAPMVTEADVDAGMAITATQAEHILRTDVERVALEAMRRLVTVPLNQNQVDALASWTFNLGAGALERSGLLRRLNAGDYGAVPDEMRRWVYAGEPPQQLPGLVKRREAEARLWAEPVVVEPEPPAPPPDPVDPAPPGAMSFREYIERIKADTGAREVVLKF